MPLAYLRKCGKRSCIRSADTVMCTNVHYRSFVHIPGDGPMETANLDKSAGPSCQKPSSAPFCPLCNGRMQETRGQWQCSQCRFTVCEDCGGVEPMIGLSD